MKKFEKQISSIQTESQFRVAVIAINQAYSSYKLSHSQWTNLREHLIAKRLEKGFRWGRNI